MFANLLRSEQPERIDTLEIDCGLSKKKGILYYVIRASAAV